MNRSILTIALLLATSATALAAPATEHATSIDLFEDTIPGKPDWKAARRGAWTKPFIGWTIDAMQGDGTIDFGDVRFHDEVVTGHEDVDVVMVIRINGIDDYMWPYWQEEPGLWLASKPKNPSHISSDPSTRIWSDQPGFYLWGHDITNLKIVGLPWSSKTTVEVWWLTVTGTHDSMAANGLTHCVGTDLVINKFGSPFICGGTDLNLAVLRYQSIRPFLSATEIIPPATKSEADVPKVVDPPGMRLK